MHHAGEDVEIKAEQEDANTDGVDAVIRGDDPALRSGSLQAGSVTCSFWPLGGAAEQPHVNTSSRTSRFVLQVQSDELSIIRPHLYFHHCQY